MYYLIHSQYVGPNKKDSRGNYMGRDGFMFVCTEPGRTNMSHEVRLEGWLGTTNDNCEIAHGAYETLEEARAAAAELGFTENEDSEEVDQAGEECEAILLTERDAREQWGVGDWLEYFDEITTETTDEEIESLAAELIEEARGEGIELRGGVEHYLTGCRDSLRADAEVEE